MRIEEKIAAACLFGLIRRETMDEQIHCLHEIEIHYGHQIAGIVKGLLKGKYS